ncbi:hypothetical protein [Rothia mucilaginosa]|jgi:hypothetical protein|uniref:hypothetical protein n=1 Tax=Rothia mucilaginosa TaxID=43675 RepID=UPI0028D10C03|nr:hypothetical protein [Rothia mucilaginosa]
MENISRKQFVIGSGLSMLAGMMGMPNANAAQPQESSENFEAILHHGAYFPTEEELRSAGLSEAEIDKYRAVLRSAPSEVLEASRLNREKSASVTSKPVQQEGNKKAKPYFKTSFVLRFPNGSIRRIRQSGTVNVGGVEVDAFNPGTLHTSRVLYRDPYGPNYFIWGIWRHGNYWNYLPRYHAQTYSATHYTLILQVELK